MDHVSGGIPGEVVEINDDDVFVLRGHHERFILANVALDENFDEKILVGETLRYLMTGANLTNWINYDANIAEPVA